MAEDKNIAIGENEKKLRELRKVLDELVEDGLIRIIGTRGGRNVYALTEVGRSPHLVPDPPKTTQ